MRLSQAEKAERFRALHSRPGAFVIPNPWDAGTARILASLGFEALTTTSAGLAFTLGRRDGAGMVTRDETLANARAIVDATDLPVAADLENGFGHTPEAVAETIRLAAEVAGLVGGSIEDATGDPRRPIYDFPHAVERVAAAVEAARALPFPFVLVGRAENFLHGRPDLDDTIRRLQAFEAAGADALYAPGLTRAEDIRTVCAAVRKPVNVVMGTEGCFALRRRAGRPGGPADQRGLRVEPGGPGRLRPGRARDSGTRDVHLRRRGHPLRGSERHHGLAVSPRPDRDPIGVSCPGPTLSITWRSLRFLVQNRGNVMTATRLPLFLTAALLASAHAATFAAEADPDHAATHPVVVELFTSQGCSSCPPADRLLTELGRKNGGELIPLAFHVDIWNHIGWTDPFSSSDWTRRQTAYARRLGLANIYTPQVVVDGAAEMLGSDSGALESAVKVARTRPAAAIALQLEPSGRSVAVRADVDLPGSLRDRKWDLMLAVFETDLETPVARGENGGKTLRNDYVVRSLRRAGRLTASESLTASLQLDGQWNPSRIGVAAFLQDPRSLEIRGASAQRLREASARAVRLEDRSGAQ